MTSQGADRSVSRFRRALKTRNMLLIRAAASELPHIGLPDALEVCLVLRDAEPERFQAAAIRWIARFCAEQPRATLNDLAAAADAFATLRSDPDAGRLALHDLMHRLR